MPENEIEATAPGTITQAETANLANAEKELEAAFPTDDSAPPAQTFDAAPLPYPEEQAAAEASDSAIDGGSTGPLPPAPPAPDVESAPVDPAEQQD